jgi:hypothetical protein
MSEKAPDTPKIPRPRQNTRQQKRATALRENLLKRKNQSRERQKQEKE